MFPSVLSTQQVNEFNRNGYIIIKNFCSPPEVHKLHSAAVNDHSNQQNTLGLNGMRNKNATLAQWFTPGNDVFGNLSRSEKTISSVARLLGTDSPVCHIHSKLMQKQPRTGGVWAWHQDYAYWYTNKFVCAHQMLSVMVALTAINRENGGSQLIKGSHKLGRLQHGFEADQVGADMQKVNEALKTMEMVYPELEAGDAIYFHINLLHRADENLSGQSTWANISCYSLQCNLAKKQVFTSWHTPVEVLPNEAIMECDNRLRKEKELLQKKVHALKDTVWGQLVALS